MYIIKLPKIWHIYTYLTFVLHGFELCMPIHTQIFFQYIYLLSQSVLGINGCGRPTICMNFGIC